MGDEEPWRKRGLSPRRFGNPSINSPKPVAIANRPISRCSHISRPHASLISGHLIGHGPSRRGEANGRTDDSAPGAALRVALAVPRRLPVAPVRGTSQRPIPLSEPTTFQRMGALGPARQKVADCRRIDLGIFFVRGRQCPGFAGAPDQHGVTDLDARSAVDGGIDRDVGDV